MVNKFLSKLKINNIAWSLSMKRVLWALIPSILSSVYFFGWRSLFMILIVNIFAYFSEYLFIKNSNKKVHSSVFVIATLFVLTLPPSLPLGMAVIGVIFAVIFGKMVFGGFGRNIFNPALLGRVFVCFTFGPYMMGEWPAPPLGVLKGFKCWIVDGLTMATPLTDNSMALSPDLIMGNVSGSLGETSALAVTIGGIYLYWTKSANRRIINWVFISAIFMQTLLWLLNINEQVLDPFRAICAGGFLFGLFFMATDPITAPKHKEAQILYSVFIGVMTILIRNFSFWPEGVMFSILLANVFVPITDYYFKSRKKRKKIKNAS